MFLRKLSFVVSLLCVIGVACTPSQKNEVSDVSQEIEKESIEEWTELKSNMMALREEIDEEIEELEVAIEGASDDAKENFEVRKKKLQECRVNVDYRIENMGDKLTDGWEEFVEDSKDYYKKVKEELTS